MQMDTSCSTPDAEHLDDGERLISKLRMSNARAMHLEFIKRCWLKTDEPFIEGFHTRRICDAIDIAFDKFRAGQSTFLLMAVHPRSGKSDIVSRYCGPHFLGEFPGKEVILASYNKDVAEGFSDDARNLVKSDYYSRMYPNVHISPSADSKSAWALVDNNRRKTGGWFRASGLTAGLNSKGYHLGILDDYCAGRADAESLAYRNAMWGAFTNDFMTRRAPVSITIVLATQWHVDDINGRIRTAMKEDPNFPQFEILSFPARARDWKEQHPDDEQYKGEYLFEERLGKRWYEEQYATLGKYSASALMDCNPLPRTGGRFDVSSIDYYEVTPDIRGMQWARMWDLAHTAKQRAGDDPDWTSGTKIAFERRAGDPVPHMYVDDVQRTREGALKRDAMIQTTAMIDGPYVRQAVASSLDSKDAYMYLMSALPSLAWMPVQEHGDKGARATPLEPIFSAPGHVHAKRGAWNDAWIDELLRFDGTGKQHDDQVDNMSDGYALLMGAGRVFDQAQRDAMRARRIANGQIRG